MSFCRWVTNMGIVIVIVVVLTLLLDASIEHTVQALTDKP